MKNLLLVTILSLTLIFNSCSNKILTKNIKYSSSQSSTASISENDKEDILQSDIEDKITQEEKLPIIKVTVPKINPSDLDTKERSWFNMNKAGGTAPEQPKEIMDMINKYSAAYLGDTSKKEIYLTFNNGFENGNTTLILDTLKKHNVKAAFFVLKSYIESSKDLILRMVEEGHLVVNHSAGHYNMSSIADEEKFKKELIELEEAYEKVTGKKMAKFFRPPSGTYNERALYYAANSGYKTVFWSFAYDDWNVNNQHSQDYVKKLMKERASHNGVVLMLHSVSKTNAEVLDDMITYWKDNGFEFKTLYDLP